MSFSPILVTLEPNKKYFWCTCGLSNTEPFCDGTHKGSGKRSLCFEGDFQGASEGLSEKTVLLCTCKRTKNPPYCDGSHRNC